MERILNWIFPRFCKGCGERGSYLCKECKKKLIPHPEVCPICHRHSENFLVCIGCSAKKLVDYKGLIVGFKYGGDLKKLILSIKYKHQKDIITFLAQRLNLMIKCNQYLSNENKIVLSSIPSHWIRKYFIKGYNQSELLSKSLSEISGYPYISLCKKSKYTISQTKLNKTKRSTNLEKAFIYKKEIQLSGDETILLIDDVTTTGSTINEIAKTIKCKYPGTKIRGVVLGRHA